MRTPSRALALALTVAGVLSACSDSPTEPSARSTDLASALAEMSLSSVAPAVASFGGVTPPSATRVPSNCAYDAAIQSFTCPVIVSGGVTVNNGYTLLSASGTPQSAFDPATTAAVRVTTSMVGSAPIGGSDVLNIDSRQTMTLSGLLSSQHVLDGTGTLRTFGSISGYALDETTTETVKSLVLAPTGSSNPYPRSGTISLALSDAGGSGGLLGGSFTVTMLFNGTSKVDVTFVPGGHCVFDLANPNATSSCSLVSFGG